MFEYNPDVYSKQVKRKPRPRLRSDSARPYLQERCCMSTLFPSLYQSCALRWKAASYVLLYLS